MKKIEKIAVLGGDLRQAALSAMLAEEGFETATWAVAGDVGDAVRCAEWRSAVSMADAVVLPIVAEDDMGRLNAPFAPQNEPKPTLAELLEASNAIFLGGRLPNAFAEHARARGREAVDYFLSEEIQILNALPTAEGAVALALEALDITISGARMLVVGYGRIGKALSSLLARMGAHVDVAARKRADLSRIETSGLRPRALSPETLSSLVREDYDVVFNTVPCVIFDGEILLAASKKTIYVDLASAPGGFDLSAAHRLGLNVMRALSLPGKYFPRTAGRIIGRTVIDHIKEFEAKE